jgi:ABC-type amino acid transport substrate-binding protein
LISKNIGCFNTTITTENINQYHRHTPPLFIEGVSVFAQVNSTIRDVKIKDTEGKTFAYTIGYPYSQEILKKQKIKAVGAISDQHQIKMLTAGRNNTP